MVTDLSDKISRYLKGEFDYESGSLVFSCSKIEINMKCDESTEGSFTLEEQSGKTVTARVFSTNLLLECPSETFRGSLIEIPYSVNTFRKQPGDVIKGEVHVISDMGEYAVPYVINVIHETMESSLGNIKNLFHFTNLAKSNWEEAVKLFYHEKFETILTGNDGRFRSLYRGLTSCGNPNRNLEEFLIGINKKKEVEYEVDTKAIKLINPENNSAHKLRINCIGWGLLQLKVEAQGEFIRLERRTLTDDDFIGNTCDYCFYIDDKALHVGNNFGRLHFIHAYGSFDVDVQIVNRMDGSGLNTAHREKKIVYSLTRYYLDFRMKRLSLQKWLAQTKELLEHYRIIESDHIDSSLFEAHLLLTQEHYNEAKWMLDHAIEDPESLEDTRYCYYLYLTSLYNVDDFYSKQAAERMLSIYRKNPDNWRIAWLLLYMPGAIGKTVGSKWNFALEQIAKGCDSPVFYLESLMLLNSEPSLLIHLEDAQLRLLQFGAKMQFLSPELMQQITNIAGRVKLYDARLLHILQLIYNRRPNDETLQVICMLLMKGGCCDKDSYGWYEKGIESDLSITKLYEYYMMSMDITREHEIHKKALMYFSYQCMLSGEYTAYLYRYVVKNRDRLGELYEMYYPQIARFLVKQLYAGKISSELAYLYQEILIKEMATPDNIQQFSTLIFVNKVTVEASDITGVVVLDDRLGEERIYSVANHHAYVKLFSNGHTILLEDGNGNRYYGRGDYQMECFFLPRKFISLLKDHARDSIEYNLYLCGDNRDLFTVTPKNADRCRYLIQEEKVETEFCKALRMSLITYYFEQDESHKLEELLEGLQPADIPYKNRTEVVKYLAIYGMNEKAYEFTVAYGVENIDAKTIVRFCSGLLETEGMVESREMTCLLYSAFERGKYNELVLEYLIRFYNGLAKHLRNIWKAAVSFEMDAYIICERLLLQTLETGAYIAEEGQIYLNFAKGNSNTDIDCAYLSYKCYEYLVHDRLVAEYIFEGVGNLAKRITQLPDVCMMAYLKHYSQKANLPAGENARLCEQFLHELYAEKNITLPFFAHFKDISRDAALIANSELVEYKGNPESTVVIHYIISKEDEEAGDYVSEEMKNMFGGIFVKEFLLFFGETLQYYVTEEFGNKEQLTESGTIQKSDALSLDATDRYAMVNDIAIATTLKDYSTSKELLEEYSKKEFMAQSLFSLQ